MADSSHGRFYGIMVDMFCENNTVSLTRVISAFSYLLFAFVSIWLMATGMSWSHYDIFASYTGAGGAALQLANKLVSTTVLAALMMPLLLMANQLHQILQPKLRRSHL